MTNTHYLLLTDEERVLYERLAEGLPESARMFAAALMAARAENKRKDEMLHDVDTLLDGMSLLGVHDWLLPANRDVYADVHQRVRALLQSEKGGE